jgi:hypothetical protein
MITYIIRTGMAISEARITTVTEEYLLSDSL